MKYSIGLFLLLLIAVPVFAQDDAPDGAASGAGPGQAQVFTRVDAVDPMDQVKTFLAKANIKLSGDQEKALKPDVEAALKQAQEVSDRMRAQFAARGGGERRGRGDAEAGGQGGGRRGGGGAGPGPAANNPLAAELRKINDDLITKINAALKPDQQAAFKKFRNDEIRKAGGFPTLKLVMDEAGTSFAPEQEQQIQAFYGEDARQRIQLMRESQGRPDPAKLDELEKTTMGKVIRLLTPAQRKALLDSRTKSQPQ